MEIKRMGSIYYDKEKDHWILRDWSVSMGVGNLYNIGQITTPTLDSELVRGLTARRLRTEMLERRMTAMYGMILQKILPATHQELIELRKILREDFGLNK